MKIPMDTAQNVLPKTGKTTPMLPPELLLFPGSSSSSLRDNGILLLMGEVSEMSVQPIVEAIIEAHLIQPRPKELKLIICSWGGDLNAAFALVDVMAGSSIPVNTIGLGAVGSAGFLIFIAGKHRTLTPNSTVLSHQFSSGAMGKHHDLLATQEVFDIMFEQMLQHYKRCSTLTDKVLKDKVVREKLLGPSDKYLRAKDVKKLGLCESVKDYHPRPVSVSKKQVEGQNTDTEEATT